ncbi:hypothetical protein [Abiotrophia defectiva]|uniref:hypothetical protein n=1 Tax=Abiotrophia defectiva TaxID=46125 RepID=UPI0028EFA0CC|nr:hypothetical protein [Abiotrophia defectiva]
MRRERILKAFGVGLLPLVGLAVLLEKPLWWGSVTLFVALLALAVFLFRQTDQVATSSQEIIAASISNWFLILAAFYLSPDNWLLAGHSISRLWGLVLVTLVHLGVLVLHVTSRQVSRQTARQVMVISLGYMMLMGLLVAGLLAMEMSSVIAVCLLLASMIYFLLTLSYLSKRAEGK